MMSASLDHVMYCQSQDVVPKQVTYCKSVNGRFKINPHLQAQTKREENVQDIRSAVESSTNVTKLEQNSTKLEQITTKLEENSTKLGENSSKLDSLVSKVVSTEQRLISLEKSVRDLVTTISSLSSLQAGDTSHTDQVLQVYIGDNNQHSLTSPSNSAVDNLGISLSSTDDLVNRLSKRVHDLEQNVENPPSAKKRRENSYINNVEEECVEDLTWEIPTTPVTLNKPFIKTKTERSSHQSPAKSRKTKNMAKSAVGEASTQNSSMNQGLPEDRKYSKPLYNNTTALNWQEAQYILTKTDPSQHSVDCVLGDSVKDGDIFLFDTNQMDHERNYLIDMLGSWGRRTGSAKLPLHDPKMVKCSYKNKNGNLRKNCWTFYPKTDIVLVQYTGDPRSVVLKPHGNCKTNSKVYQRTPKSATKSRSGQISMPVKTYQDRIDSLISELVERSKTIGSEVCQNSEDNTAVSHIMKSEAPNVQMQQPSLEGLEEVFPRLQKQSLQKQPKQMLLEQTLLEQMKYAYNPVCNKTEPLEWREAYYHLTKTDALEHTVDYLLGESVKDGDVFIFDTSQMKGQFNFCNDMLGSWGQRTGVNKLPKKDPKMVKFSYNNKTGNLRRHCWTFYPKTPLVLVQYTGDPLSVEILPHQRPTELVTTSVVCQQNG